MPQVDAQVVRAQERLPVAADADAVDVVRVRIGKHAAALGLGGRLSTHHLHTKPYRIIAPISAKSLLSFLSSCHTNVPSLLGLVLLQHLPPWMGIFPVTGLHVCNKNAAVLTGLCENMHGQWKVGSQCVRVVGVYLREAQGVFQCRFRFGGKLASLRWCDGDIGSCPPATGRMTLDPYPVRSSPVH